MANRKRAPAAAGLLAFVVSAAAMAAPVSGAEDEGSPQPGGLAADEAAAEPDVSAVGLDVRRDSRLRVDELGAEHSDWIATWARRLAGEVASNGGGFGATLQSGWIVRRPDRPQVYLTLHLDQETSQIELRGGGLRFGDRGVGLYLERGETDRDLRMGLDFRLVF